MYLVIRKFSRMRTVHEAARRAESGIGKLMKEASGFRGYYIFDAGGGVAGSVTLFETREAAEAANEKRKADEEKKRILRRIPKTSPSSRARSRWPAETKPSRRRRRNRKK